MSRLRWACWALLATADVQAAATGFAAADEASDAPTGTPTPAQVLRAQVLLERAHFSPGEIDGRVGSNFARALRGYQQHAGIEVTGKLDARTWEALAADASPVLVDYTIAAADVAGPFAPLPEEMAEKATLPALGYESPLEGLAEKFHAAPALLQALNDGADFASAGTTIRVPAVDAQPPPKAARVVVDKSDSTLALLDEAGNVVAQYPATTGSEHDPLPIGDWKIKGVAKNPVFHYNPELFWDAEANDEKATLKPGPNNPVGTVWVDLDIPHYGIHGTPEPATIAKTQSHGCIRLTNWSAVELSGVVAPGTPATLQE